MDDAGRYWQVEVRGVEHDGGKPVVILRDETDRLLPIVIGHCEAVAIAQRLDDDFDPPRPFTQDLALALFKRLAATLTQVRIDDLWEGVYYSKLTLEQEGRVVEVDCRPSDGIALALAAGAPILVAEKVMAEGGQTPES